MIDDITEYVYKVQRLKNDFHRQEFDKLLEANSKFLELTTKPEKKKI